MDEVVVVDTGSVDNTRELAVDLGARLFEFEWIEDYAAARNEALRHCRGEWILSLDADERYRPCSRDSLEPLLRDFSKAAYSTIFRMRREFTPYRRIRLFRNHEFIRYKGAIHENVLDGVAEYCKRHGAGVGDSPLFGDHVGYDFKQDEKNERSLRLLKECVEKEPGRTLLWCHLANVHASLGDPESAEKCWRRGVEMAESRADGPGLYDSVPYLGLLEWLISRGEDATDVLQSAKRKLPGNLQLRWFEGRLLMADGRYGAAIGCFEELLHAGQDPDFDQQCGNPSDDWDHWFGYDENLFGVLSYESLATCHLQMGQHEESLNYLDRCLVQEPERKDLLLKKRLCKGLLRKKKEVSSIG